MGPQLCDGVGGPEAENASLRKENVSLRTETDALRIRVERVEEAHASQRRAASAFAVTRPGDGGDSASFDTRQGEAVPAPGSSRGFGPPVFGGGNQGSSIWQNDANRRIYDENAFLRAKIASYRTEIQNLRGSLRQGRQEMRVMNSSVGQVYAEIAKLATTQRSEQQAGGAAETPSVEQAAGTLAAANPAPSAVVYTHSIALGGWQKPCFRYSGTGVGSLWRPLRRFSWRDTSWGAGGTCGTLAGR